jgi:outer membrane cobalamin receptor
VKAIIYAAAALSAAAGFESVAQAQSASSLDEVVVTAKSLEDELPQQLSLYGTRVDTISAAQIKNGGYLDVAGALEALSPGLYISPRNGPFDYVQISLQGSRTTDVLWLVDGIRINNRLYAGTTPLDTLPAGLIDRIEVLNGGQALFYGTQAVAGAINIVTTGFSNHRDGAVSFGYDTSQAQQYNGYYRDTIGNNHFVVYATHDQAPGVQPLPDDEFQPSGTDRRRFYKVTSLGAKYAHDFADNLTITAAYEHTNANLDFAQPELTAIAYNQRNEDLVSAKLDYAPSDEFKLFVKDYYHWWYSHYTEFDNVVGSPGTLTTIDDHDFWGFKDYGVNLLTQIEVNRGFEYLAGYDFQNYSGKDVVLVIQQQTEHVSAFFGQIRTTPDLIPNAHFAAGLRYNIPSVGESALVWNGGGQYDFFKALFVRANIGTAFRLPTAEELFANDPQDERGNPNLKPETSTNANVSVGGIAGLGSASLKWEFIGFYRDIKNLIDFAAFDPDTGQDVFGNVADTVITRGLEFTLDGAISAAFSGNFSATYNRTRETGSDVQFIQIPVTQVKLGFDYHPPGEPYGASVNIVHLGSVDDTPLGSDAGRFGYGNYTVVDVGARLFLDSRHHQRIDLHLNNAFDRTYSSSLGHGVDDVSGDAYVVHNLALPRTFGINYTYSF